MTNHPPTPWQGRDDGPDPSVQRWHQRVKVLNGTPLPYPNGRPACLLLGFAVDEGVRRNMGRLGAAQGPEALRKAMASLPVHFSPEALLMDAGDVTCPDGDLLDAQRRAGQTLSEAQAMGYKTLLLGGGHEVAYADWLGLTKGGKPKTETAVVNLDAHFDLRDAMDGQPTSGNSFTLMHRDAEAAGQSFKYAVAGIQRIGNTPLLFDKAKAMDAFVAENTRFGSTRWESLLDDLVRYTDGYESKMLTVCLDVFSAAHAPGVSAPSPLGLVPDADFHLFFRALLERISFNTADIAELNPEYDQDSRTAKLAAALAFEIVTHWLSE